LPGFGLAATLLVLLPVIGFAQEDTVPADSAQAAPEPELPVWKAPAGITASDAPNDNGHGILVEWQLSDDDASLLMYQIFRGPDPDAPDAEWFQVGTAPRGTGSFTYYDRDRTLEGETNPKFVAIGEQVYVKVRGIAADGTVSGLTPVATGIGHGNWYHKGKTPMLVGLLFFGFWVVYFIVRSRKGTELYIRPIPGLSAVDEAIGRATEMGRPILYVLGTGTASEIGTIAGYTILARVAKKTAEYQTPILVPVNDPVMLAMGQEVVREAYLQAGHPEVYRPENVFYVSAMQFPYVAAVNGLMLREKTATNFYMGVFHAESLLLAEAGSLTGAIQVSGTDQQSQLPFFVAATDYTLIGEELYAASAYLSQEPILLGPLKAQDLMKVVFVILIAGAVIGYSLFDWDGIAQLIHTEV
jgi:hypothetical protein